MKTHETYILELSERNPDIECLGIYSGATTKILHRCKKCGHKWLVRPTSLVSQSPKGCPHCAAVKAGRANKSYTTESYRSALSEVNPDIVLAGDYPGSHLKADFECLRCGHKWKARPYSILQGHGCPRCVKTGTSFMEQVILGAMRASIGEDMVLSRDREAIGEELDVYIPSVGVAIEPGSWTLHRRRIWKDREKRSLCDASGIRLFFVFDMFPPDEPAPFQKDCITFHGDFNREDHSCLWDAINELSAAFGCHRQFSKEEKLRIEAVAYERSKSLTHEAFVERMSAIHPTIEVLGRYENSNRRVRCRCTVCSREWDAVPASLLYGDGCWDCARRQIGESQRLSFEEYSSILRGVDPTISVDPSSYRGTHSRVRATCLKCGRVWEPVARTLIRANPCGCSACRKVERLAKLDLEYRKALGAQKPHITCLGSYVTRETKLLHRCELCGYEWMTTPATVLASKHGCPNWKSHKLCGQELAE